MSTAINLPRLAVSMTEGSLVGWLVNEGERINAGDPLYVVETDKVETEITSPASGVVRIIGIVGETYAVGDLIAEID